MTVINTSQRRVWQGKEAMSSEMSRRPRAVVVGGSIAGLSCAHTLIGAGWDVTVIEKSITPPVASPTGAGLSLEPQAQEIIGRWLSDPDIINRITLLLSVELHQAIDSESKTKRVMAKDESFNYRCAHWTDLHSAIHKALPSDIILWGHRFLSLHFEDKASVRVKALVLRTNEVVEIVGHLLVAADGCSSMIRKHFLPEHKLRYSGYSAWRGVFDYIENEHCDAIVGIKKAHPELGNCLYFEMTDGAHCAFFELSNKRINWIWYFNRPEPELQGGSVTMKVSDEMIEKMHEEAEKVWSPELAKLMKETKDPFINVIYDSDPLPRLYWDNVVLVGDAAHPTTPHASRSTNMSILDAEVLGLCIRKWGSKNLLKALQEFQSVRLPVVSKQVLHSRYNGRLKQGLAVDSEHRFHPESASAEECKELQHKSLPFFEQVPVSI